MTTRDLRAVTLEELQARAKVTLHYDSSIIAGLRGSNAGLMVAALLRDLTAGVQA